MVKLNENFIVDKDGNRLGVFLEMKSFKKILEELEELDEIRAYDNAKSRKDEAISFEHAIKKIEKNRRK